MSNRFLLLDRNLSAASTGVGVARQAGTLKKEEKCQQFNEIEVGDDEFVLDVLQFFFEERLRPDQLNAELRDMAAFLVWEATEGSRAMDLVPRPTGSRPTVGWLVSQAVQIAFRRAQNKCFYEAVRVTVKLKNRSAYVLARDGVMGMSVSPEEGVVVAGRVDTTSKAGVDMIAGFERFKPQPYEDAAGDCRIGYGHLVHRGPCDGSERTRYPAGISEPQARDLLVEQLKAAEAAVASAAATTGLPQTKFDALVSFVDNVGIQIFEGSRVRTLVASGRLDGVSAELRRWVNAEGTPLRELERRREAEAKLFDDGLYPGTDAVAQLTAVGLDLADFEVPYVREASGPIVDWCQIRHGIVRSAVEEQGAWLRSSGGLHGEGEATVLPLLEKYWEVGAGLSASQASAMAALSASDHPTDGFWSAAFISWCVRNAMPSVPHDAGWVFSGLHMKYIAGAARNRNAADPNRPFWLFDINDTAVVPEEGDILCLNRSGTQHSYQTVVDNWVVKNPTGSPTGSSHTDIVIGHFERDGRRWIETVGGNVDDTVASRYYSLDASGRLVDQVLLNGTPVARRTNVTQTVGSRGPIVFALIRLTACARR